MQGSPTSPQPPAASPSTDFLLQTLPPSAPIFHHYASIIQRNYKRYTQRRIYHYFRSLILSRQASNPYLLLKLLAPSETSTNDHATGLYIRFRLGGSVFPPILYYKIFTQYSITDIGAFAPRDYARDRKMVAVGASSSENAAALNSTSTIAGSSTAALSSSSSIGTNSLSASTTTITASTPTDRAYWYRRYENNGWRPIINDSILIERDAVHEETSQKRVVFHPNKLVRRLDALKKRKGKKIEWLKKLYSSGVIALPTKEQLEKGKRMGDVDGENEDGENKDGFADPSASPATGSDPYDSDDADWHAWKSASTSRLPPHSPPARSGIDLLTTLQRIDTTSAPALLQNTQDWEEEADALLNWCNGLVDYEGYQDTWTVQATSKPNQKERKVDVNQNTIMSNANSNSTIGGRNSASGGRTSLFSSAGSKIMMGGIEEEKTNSTSFNNTKSKPSFPPTGGTIGIRHALGATALQQSPSFHAISAQPQSRHQQRPLSSSSIGPFSSDTAYDSDQLALEEQRHLQLQDQLAEENAGLPSWIGESASRAHLHSFNSQKSLLTGVASKSSLTSQSSLLHRARA